MVRSTSEVPPAKLLIVEFAGEYPFHIETAEWDRDPYRGVRGPFKRIWDVDYSERDKRLLFHCSGFGGDLGEAYMEHPESHRYWLAPGVTLKNAGKGQRLARMPRGMRKVIERGMADEVGDIVYCSICSDCFDGTDDINVCSHIHWCDLCGGWAGKGAADGYSDCRHNIIEPWDEDDLDESLELTHL